jgi:hypothetical protein
MQWKSNTYYIFRLCFLSFRCPVCNVHALYCPMWPVRLYRSFTRYLINGAIFEKKVLLNTKCLFWFTLQLLSEALLILRRTERDMTINVYWSSCKVSVAFVRFWRNLNFLVRFSKNTKIFNKIKIRPVKAEFFHVDRERHD